MTNQDLIALLASALAEIKATSNSKSHRRPRDKSIEAKLEAALVTLQTEPASDREAYAQLQLDFKALQTSMSLIEKSMKHLKPAKPVKAAKVVDTTQPFYRASTRWTKEEIAILSRQVTGSGHVPLAELCKVLHRSPSAVISRLHSILGFPAARWESLANALINFNRKCSDQGKPASPEILLAWASKISIKQIA